MKITDRELSLGVKSKLRKQCLAQRQQRRRVSSSQFRLWETVICSRLRDQIDRRQAKSIMFYYPHNGEVSLLSLVYHYWRKSNSTETVLFPRVEGEGKMVAVSAQGEDDLIIGFKGIREPKGDRFHQSIDLILVPGVAFMTKGEQGGLYRLGYGGGYYDRFLQQYPRAYKVGVFFGFQETSIDFHESRDVGLDMIVTEGVVYG